MNLEVISKLFIPMVLVFCLCIGYLMKNYMPADNKIIPTVLFFVGCICGVICLGVNFEAVVRGGLTGLASTGLHQSFKQFVSNPKVGGEFNKMSSAELHEELDPKDAPLENAEG